MRIPGRSALFLLYALLLAACGGQVGLPSSSAPTPTAAPRPIERTQTATPAVAPTPTAAPRPIERTQTATPAVAPTPTAAPRPIERTPTVTPTVAPTPTAPVSAAPGPTPKADYQFQGTLKSSIGAAPALVSLGSTSFATVANGDAQRTVARYAANSGFSLSPTTGLIINTTYTIAISFSFDTTSGYRRILDFKGGVSDHGLYVEDGRITFNGAAARSPSVVTPGAFGQVVITRDQASTVTVYFNGTQLFKFQDSTGAAAIGPGNTLRFFRDNPFLEGTGEASSGAVGRIRVYDRVLTGAEVSTLTP